MPSTSARLLIAALLLSSASVAATQPSRDDLSKTDRARVEAVTRPATDFSDPEAFELMQGGAGTTKRVSDANALSHPAENLVFEDEQRFLVGNGLFRKDWVTAPSSTIASDGLGPLFNARACQACHIKDGRGHAPAAPEGNATSLLVRLSVEPDAEQRQRIRDGLQPAAPHPVLGFQLQDNAAAGLNPEGRVRIDYDAEPVELRGGENVSLRRPRLSIAGTSRDADLNGLRMSARVSPPMSGMGLLEAIHEADIMALSDPEDSDGDGISGRPNLVGDGKGGLVLGRFGWKAVEPTVERQTAHAFAGDMGLSTPLAPDHWGDCTDRQSDCRALPHGAQSQFGDEEVPRELLDLVVFYSRNLAVPVRRQIDAPQVLAGKKAFYEAGCVGCHVPKFVTSRKAAHEAHRFQLIWPYTDLLLHDMGEGLADNREEGLADGREWRTPPLWGIGLADQVSAEAGFLHDGRARSLLEAILWHGGEAQASRDAFATMEKAERDALIAFLESL
jgi:CxxC motif-containing protein (DUF1111 family)